jgi:hypothetical protein
LRTPSGRDPFFKSVSATDGPILQRQEAPAGSDEEEKEPVTEGLKLTAEKLGEHEPFKKWTELKLQQLKFALWDQLSSTDKAVVLGSLGINVGLGATMFALNPEMRQALSDVNIGKPLGAIPWSPIEGFKYKLPAPGKSALGFSADFTLNPYLEALQKARPGFPLTGATFGLESSYDPAHKSFGITGGKFGLDLFGGGLKAEGKTVHEVSPYPQYIPGREGMPGGLLMQSYPALPMIKTGPGFQFMLNADILTLFPSLQQRF